MFRKKYYVISPDGFPISREPFKSKRAAMKAVPEWCKQYERQGYYSTSNRDRIPLEELPDCVGVVPADEVIMKFC